MQAITSFLTVQLWHFQGAHVVQDNGREDRQHRPLERPPSKADFRPAGLPPMGRRRIPPDVQRRQDPSVGSDLRWRGTGARFVEVQEGLVERSLRRCLVRDVRQQTKCWSMELPRESWMQGDSLRRYWSGTRVTYNKTFQTLLMRCKTRAPSSTSKAKYPIKLLRQILNLFGKILLHNLGHRMSLNYGTTFATIFFLKLLLSIFTNIPLVLSKQPRSLRGFIDSKLSWCQVFLFV